MDRSDHGFESPSAGHAMDDLLGSRQVVHFEMEIEGGPASLTVAHVELYESLGELYDGRISATFGSHEHVDEHDLLAKNVTLRIERGVERRSFRGIVRTATVRGVREHQELDLTVVPALWLASEIVDSRIYQDISVPDLVEQLVEELLGKRERKMKKELTRTYDKHEYLVQHRESHYDFLARLMREEGIFYYFDHDDDESQNEVLVLADSNRNLRRARESHGGFVDYEEQEDRQEGREVAFEVHRRESVGASDVAIRGKDWTNPPVQVQHERKQRADWKGPPLEVYDHHHAVRYHAYDEGGGSYTSHTAELESQLKAERLDLARHSWTVSTTVVTAQPGRVFELRGADAYDGRYLIVSMTGFGDSGNEHGGTYANELVVVPEDMPYRLPKTERRSMPGPETATVVGPSGEEIWTDKHGRIKVQFHWDRQGKLDEHSSAWIRVQQNWAGAGWGFVFIPRIGMEVIVQFLGGDPDRPIVTGCLYNGTNTPPYPLPADKTKSTIKTNSSLGGGAHGSNELRFEDKKGSEEVYIHAEKDFNEIVEHDHSTHVKNDQTNTVDGNQTEKVGKDQKMTVVQNRTKTIEQNETTTVKGERKETVEKDEHVKVQQNRSHQVLADDTLQVGGKHTLVVKNGQITEILGDRNSTVTTHDNLTVAGQYNIEVGSSWKAWCTHSNIFMDGKRIFGEAAVVDLQGLGGHAQLVITATGAAYLKAVRTIELECGASKIVMSPSEVSIEAPTVRINAAGGNCEIDAQAQVRIKC